MIKPLVGARGRRPRRMRQLSRRCSVHGKVSAVGCGVNPRYGDLDPYAMAAAAMDEAVRQRRRGWR